MEGQELQYVNTVGTKKCKILVKCPKNKNNIDKYFALIIGH